MGNAMAGRVGSPPHEFPEEDGGGKQTENSHEGERGPRRGGGVQSRGDRGVVGAAACGALRPA